MCFSWEAQQDWESESICAGNISPDRFEKLIINTSAGEIIHQTRMFLLPLKHKDRHAYSIRRAEAANYTLCYRTDILWWSRYVLSQVMNAAIAGRFPPERRTELLNRMNGSTGGFMLKSHCYILIITAVWMILLWLNRGYGQVTKILFHDTRNVIFALFCLRLY